MFCKRSSWDPHQDNCVSEGETAGPDQQVPELRGQKGQKISGLVSETLRGGISRELAGDCSQGKAGRPRADGRENTGEGVGGNESQKALWRRED